MRASRLLLLASLAARASAQDLSCRGKCRGATKRCIGDFSMQNVADEDCAQVTLLAGRRCSVVALGAVDPLSLTHTLLRCAAASSA